MLTAAVGSLLVLLAEGRQSTQHIVRIETIENCRDRPNTTEYLKKHNYLMNVNTMRVKLDQYINAEYVINRQVNKMQGVVEMNRCESRDAVKCEHFLRWKLPNMCGELVKQNQLWTPFVAAIQPKLKCPITKQTYHFVNATFSNSAATSFVGAVPGATTNFWSFIFSYMDGPNEDELGCVHIVMKLYTVRVKQ